MNEENLFHRALDKPAGERAAFLEQACGGDAALRQRVEVLLQAHDNPGSFLNQPAVNLAATAASQPGQVAAGESPDWSKGEAPGLRPLSEGPGSRIGPYKLLQQIGEGGMGAVWMAEQAQPVQRKVALKIIKPGLDSAQVIARFEAERQALALMDHPNIAKVLDAGTTESTRPYFVMELVKGVPLTKYCDELHLTPRQRLELFVPVCQAVQHAHTKGIIHRDLKPSNVLIALYDDKPVPKVIDFGVAKAMGPRLTERTLFTEFGAIVGTLEYMSPEQAQLNQLDIDTRSDVYSLGVLLYELLTGTTPLEHRRLKEAGFLEVLRLIREEEPPRPSTRLSTTEELPAIAANRGLEPKKLSGLVRGELDWIVMKCLDKDRNRRYQTANGLAHDIERYLHDEPVEACPPSAGYRLRKFARKYKKVLATAAAFVLLLILGVAVSVWQAVRATHAEGEARGAEGEARQAEAKAKAEKEQKEIEAAISQAVSTFVQEDLLGQAAAELQTQPGRPADGEEQVRPDRDVKVRALLDRAAERVGVRFKDQPKVEAAIRLTIGNAYRALGEYAKARPHLEKALQIRRTELPAGHPDTLAAINSLAYLYFQMGGGLRDRAEPLLIEALEGCRRTLPSDHPLTLTSMHNLSLVESSDPRYLPEPLLLQALEGRRRVLGEEHPDTLRSLHGLAVLQWSRGQRDRAEPLFRKVLDGQRRVLGNEHPLTLLAMNNLAALYQQWGQYGLAEPLLVQALEASRRVLGPEHDRTRLIRKNLIWLYLDQRQYAKAEPLVVEVANTLLALGDKEGRSDSMLLFADRLGEVYAAQGGLNLLEQKKYAEAEPVLRTLLDYPFEDKPWLKPQTQSLLGACLAGQKKYAEAEPLLLSGYEGLKAGEATIPMHQRKRVTEALERVARLYEAWDRPEPAAEWRRKLDDEKQRRARQDDAIARHDRGQALARQGQYEQAEAAFREAIRLEPDFPEAHRALGEILCYHKHDFDGAIAAFREAVRLQPEDAANRCGLGNALARKGDLAAAVDEYREALPLLRYLRDALIGRASRAAAEAKAREVVRQQPEDADARYRLARALAQRQGKLPEAAAEYREALRLRPGFADAQIGLADALRFQRKFPEAAAAYQEAVRLKPADADAHANLGLTLSTQGKRPEAEAAFREAIRLKPDHGWAHDHLDKFLRLQNKPDADTEFREAARLRPQDPDAHYRLGCALAQRGQIADAEAAFRDAIRLKPGLADAHAGLARVFTRQGKHADAETAYREALRLQPGHADVYTDLGRNLTQQKKHAGAEEAFREAARLKPEDWAAHSSLAAALSEQGKDAQAVAEYRELLRLDPGYSGVRSAIDKLLRRQGKPPEAVAFYKETDDLKPELAQTYDVFAASFRRQGKLAEAEAAYREAVRLQPDDANAHSNLGVLLFNDRRDYEGALAGLREAARLRPANAVDRWNLGLVLERLGKPAEAEPEYREAVHLKPDYLEAYYGLARALAGQGKLADAVAAYKEATRVRTDDPEPHGILGDFLAQQGKLPEAEAAYREALRLQPGHARAQAALDAVLRRQGKPTGEEDKLREAIRRKPNDANAHYQLGHDLLRQGKYAEAEAPLQEAIRLKPAFSLAHFALGDNHAVRGQWDKAATAYAKAFDAAEPNDPVPWLRYASLQLQAGRDDGYRKVCRRMLERFGQVNNIQEIAYLAHACVLAPNALPDAARVLQLAEQRAALASAASLHREWSPHVLGLAHYRAGQYEKALQTLSDGLKTGDAGQGNVLNWDVGNWLLAAMAHQRLNHAALAQEWLNRAQHWIEKEVRGQAGPRAREALPERDWAEWALIDLLHREAKALGIPGLARGDAHAERGDWEKAAADFAVAFGAEPSDDPVRWFEYAGLLLRTGDAEGYRKLCVRMREQFGARRDGAAVGILAHACVLGPDALGDADAVVRLAEERLALTAPPSGHHYYWSIHVVGLAYYRAGQYQKAVDWLSKAMKDDPGWEYPVPNWLVLSMAHQRLGHAEEAQQWFDKAKQWFGEKTRSRPADWTRAAPPGWQWWDWLGVQVLCREAETLLKGADRPAGKDKEKGPGKSGG
jgi:non-specific serine/threonine protein kinase/serine/threonine-protein kinase